jgi:hypothetical protein
MGRKYDQVHDGEWIRPTKRDYRERCCDCGLVHKITYRIRDGRVEFKAVRDKRATAASRRPFKIEKGDD